MNGVADHTGVAITAVDDTGVWGTGDLEGVYDVLFDDRRIWSFWFQRDSEPVDSPDGPATRVARWPRALRHHLDGHARLVVREHVGEAVLFDDDVQFGDSPEPVRIADREGRPLAVDKAGDLHRMFAEGAPGDRDTLLDTVEDVLDALTEIGIHAFPAYGTLLGAVREGRLIGHDSDVDLAYVSTHTVPVDLIRESYRIDRHLRDRGYSVQRHSGFAMKIYVEQPDGSERGLDVFGGAYIDGTLYVMGEIAAALDRDQVYPLGTCTLEGRTLPAPADADAWLEMTYGPGWRVPDPAFHFGTPHTTRRRLDGWFRGTRRFRDDWDRFWQRNRFEPEHEPSDLARRVRDDEPDAELIIDLGSGDGNDVLWHASNGIRAVGLDYSYAALKHARHWAEHQGAGAQFESLNLCDMRSVWSVGAWIARLPGRKVVTARLLVCSLDHRVRRNFWRFCSMVGRGSRIYLQVVDPDQRGKRGPVNRLLHPLGPDAIAEELQAAGGRIIQRDDIDPEASGDEPRYTQMVVTWE